MPLQVVESYGDDRLARVFIVRLADGSLVECVEAVQPPVPRDQKWVLIVSTLKGCPIKCPICDAGAFYFGKLAAAEMLDQVDLMVRRRYPDGRVPVTKFKVQFARMGEPALNDAVLEALRELPARLDAPGLMPCLSTIAPRGRTRFFDELARIKSELYGGGRFTLQFSLHSTDEQARRLMVPADTWSLEEMAAYGRSFVEAGDRKVTLNFAPARGLPLDPHRLAGLFAPEAFLVKLTPINPTRAAARASLVGAVDPDDIQRCESIADLFRAFGFETLVSIGELEENSIGSNCGMCVRAHLEPASDSASQALTPATPARRVEHQQQ
jgi:23S rRNA (adenine2503-C2)-methyltransferase